MITKRTGGADCGGDTRRGGAGDALREEPFPPLPDEDTEREMYQATERILAEYGYHRYEISNYAKEGYECRHNLGYWERKEYLGLGLGAASLLRTPEGDVRFHNTADRKKYMECFQEKAGRNDTEPAAEEIELLGTEEQMEEFMFLGLRKTAGIAEHDFFQAFGRRIGDVYGAQIEKLSGLGLLERFGGRVRLTERGIDISNSVFCEFLSDP